MATARTLKVGVHSLYQRITDALMSAERGDTILIAKGQYTEGTLIVAKPLVVLGETGAVIDGAFTGGTLMTIQSDNVVVKGLTFRNVAVSYVDDNAAIKVDKSNHIRIANNVIENAMFGVYLRSARNIHISDNTIISRLPSEESNSGNGIHCWTSKHLLIENNTVQGHRDGIYFEFARHTLIRNNTSRENLRYGLHFMFSDSCTYERNVFEHNGAGIAVMYTKHVRMAYNTFKDNWGPNTYGLLLKDISHSHLLCNTFVRNSIAIHNEGSSKNLYEGNVFQQNGYAIRVLGNCTENTIRGNTFTGNVFDVTTNTRNNPNYYHGNYWSAYNGYDLNRDGYGDVPHHPVRLFSLMVEQMQSSTILLHSALVHTLDITERVIPTLTPAALVDRNPLMKPPKRCAP